MGLIKKFINWRKRSKEDPIYEIEDWNEIVYDRDDLQIKDKGQRQEYVKGCLEQIAEAEKELENLQFEYNMVTSYLKDMEEIDALPPEEKELLKEHARRIDDLEHQQSGYLERKNRMSDARFRQMERMEDELQEGCRKLEEAEKYQELVKRDLKRLDGEKQAYLFRKSELRHTIDNTRSLSVVCTAAVVLCILLLLFLQFGMEMDTQIGYLATVALGAVAITAIFVRHNGAVEEIIRVESGICKIIRLQNTVKIRYINNTNLLEYLYMKYNVSSAGELLKGWRQYLEEKEERKSYMQAERELDESQKDLIHELRRFQIRDPMIWLHQIPALLDRKEMVEIRHGLIIRRQSLRRRMDYNKEVIAGKAQAEIKDLAEKYPEYAKEILGIVGQYEQEFS